MATRIGGMAGMDMSGMKSPPPSPPMPAAGGGGGMPHGHGMHMTFFWGSHVQILFSGWPGNRGIGIYILALIIVLAVSAMLELLSFVSGRLSRHPKQSLSCFLLTVLHAVRMLLAVMLFNVGVLIAAIAGHAIGYLICGREVFKQSRSSPGDGAEQPANYDCLHSAKY